MPVIVIGDSSMAAELLTVSVNVLVEVVAVGEKANWTQMRHDGWAELVNDDEHGGCLIPMMMLCHEHDKDPAMRPKPISPKKREEVIMHMAAGLVAAYRYFREHRQAEVGTRTSKPRRSSPKVGRNAPCPCGSGKKYKRCCGGAMVN